MILKHIPVEMKGQNPLLQNDLPTLNRILELIHYINEVRNSEVT